MRSQKLSIPIILALSSLGLSLACSSSSQKSENPDSTTEPGTVVIPGTGSGGDSQPIVTVPLPSQTIDLKPLAQRSANEFCEGLSQFFQNYAASKAPSATISLIKEDGSTCRIDSEAQNIGFHSSVLFMRGERRLRIAVNLVANISGDSFGDTTLYLDRIGSQSQTFEATSSDEAIGDFSLLRSELSTYTQLSGQSFRIYGKLASQAYASLRDNFASGKNRAWVTNPLLRLELSGTSARVSEIAASYFQKDGEAATFLRCADLNCLQTDLSFEFKGLDLVLYSKAYYGTGNIILKDNVRLPIVQSEF